MEAADRYPIGQQDFKALRQGNAVYVDKTRYIEKIVRSNSRYYFLARPRRFGKSLFLSSLRYFFEGERDLFRGLYADRMEWSWEKYPVLYLDLNSGEYSLPENLDIVLDYMLRQWEDRYGISRQEEDITTGFRRIIESIHAAVGKKVVILVDEYDKPLVKNLNRQNLEVYREKLAALYSNFKTCSEHIRLVFMTGVSRFSRLSVFSGLNNLRDITFQNEYADICGITEAELLGNLRPGIEALAEKRKITFQKACLLLKKNYDGYRFAEEGSDIYNPWSLLNCLAAKKIANYWNHTGMPTIVVRALEKTGGNLEKYIDVSCTEDELMGLDLLNPGPIALMYQTGYLTIKDYREDTGIYRLGIPNNEVKKGFFTHLLPLYVKTRHDSVSMLVNELVVALCDGRPQTFMETLKAFFAAIPYSIKVEDENNFHNAFFLLTTLLGIDTDAEVQTSCGRIDMVLKTDGYIYVIELKYDSTARAALDQINRKEYALKYANDPRRLIKIGVNFSSKTRRIDDWIIEEEK